MTEKNKKPQIRFKGFTDDWEHRKLSELGKTQSGIGFSESEQGGTDGVPFFKVSDMNNPGNEHEMKTANNYVNLEQLQRWKWKPIEDVPSIIFAKVGAAIMLNRKRLVRRPFLIDNNTMAYIFNDSWDKDFGKTLFETIPLPRYAQIGALPSYNGSDIEAIEICVPMKEEQIKIAELFVNLDNLITLHQRKYEKLQNVKKSMLEKMFPKNEDDIPEIRFKGFTDPWEQRKLSEVVYRVSAMSDEIGLPRVEYEDINSGQGTLNKNIYEKNSTKQGVLFHENDVLFGKLRPYLKNWLFAGFSGIAVGDFWVLRGDQTDSSFVYSLIQSSAFDEVANQSTGTKMPRSDWNLVSNTVFSIPNSKGEQHQIGAFFIHLDNLITLNQHELDKLKNMKKACLEKMFI